MNLIDLLIIYFACGAPFGVYQFTNVQTSLNAKVLWQIFWHIGCWPVFAALALKERISIGRHKTASLVDRRTDFIRSEIEHLVFDGESVSTILDFREILFRYAGLLQATNVIVPADSAGELFYFGNTENKALSSACLARRNRRKLAFHQSIARNEFTDMMSELTNAHENRTEILELAIELANGVDDPITVENIRYLMSYARKPEILRSPSQSAPFAV